MRSARYVNISYAIDEDNTPLYPGTKPIAIRRVKEIAKGDPCNTSLITLSNHAGTHVDAPRHFWNSGRAISDYSLEELVFRKVVLIDCRKSAEEPIWIEDLQALKYRDDADAVLIRTGFHKYRRTDAKAYCYKNPYLSVAAAGWIRKKFYKLRAIGIDCISISSYANRKEGMEVHKILLKKKGFGTSPVLILEALNLDYKIEKIDELIVAPIFIEGVDSAPCTVIGLIYD